VTASLFSAVLLDVDGTLVDSNDAHAEAWRQAFSDNGIDVSFAAVRRCIGMGGDKLLPEVSGIEESSPTGQKIGDRRAAIFKQGLPTIRAFRDAGKLVETLKGRGFTLVAASSAKEDELHPLLETAGARDLIHGATSSDDAEESKPEPDIVHAALGHAKVSAAQAVMIGDTPYDIEAARRAGVKTIAFRSGGWSDADLAGAIAIYDGPWDLLARLDDSPLRK